MGLRQNALILLLLTALVAVCGDWAGDRLLARVWCAPAALLLLGLAYEAWMVTRAAPSLRLQAPTRWFLGRAVSLQFAVTHRLARPLTIEIAPAAAPEVSMDRTTRTIQASGDASDDATGANVLSATARRLGRYHWPKFRARVSGVLGLAWWPRAFAVEGEFSVLPDVLHESEQSRGVSARGAIAVQRIGSGGEILQLREYRPGDPQRAIDWKASARSRRLMSRDFAEDQQLDIIVAVDSGRASGLAAGDTDRLALYANVAARLAQRAATLDDRVGLLIYAERPLAAVAPGHGAAAVTRVRSLLAQMSVRPVDSNHALAAVRIRSLVRHRSLVVLLTDLDDASLTGEMRSALRLLLPKHLPFIAAVASERVEALARTAGSDELEVYRALAAQEYANALARNAASLRALGAPTVLAPPKELDRAVIEAYLNFRRRRRI
jgi:uncharacterized protein (DUF58 family)